MKRPKIWGVVGPVGVGKTTLTKALCNYYNALPVFEEWENNPYLDDFYKSNSLLDNQLWFIKNDFERLSKAIELESDVVIVDKLFIQNYSYIQITDFEEDERRKCIEEYNKGLFLLSQVDLIINLVEDGAIIRNRIASRNRDLKEETLSEDWLNLFQSYQSNYLKQLSLNNNFKTICHQNSSLDIANLVNVIDSLIE